MAADAVAIDTLKAIETLWTNSRALSALSPAIPQTGRLPSPQTQPYIELQCHFKAQELINTGGARWDHQTVMVIVRGLEKDVTTVVGTLIDIFDRNVVLVYPSGARFWRWWPFDGGDQIEQEPEIKDGQEVWKGTLTATVTSIRTTSADSVGIPVLSATPVGTQINLSWTGA